MGNALLPSPADTPPYCGTSRYEDTRGRCAFAKLQQVSATALLHNGIWRATALAKWDNGVQGRRPRSPLASVARNGVSEADNTSWHSGRVTLANCLAIKEVSLEGNMVHAMKRFGGTTVGWRFGDG